MQKEKVPDLFLKTYGLGREDLNIRPLEPHSKK
jgi:hypothetical protein